jgi:hypothetical protein
VAGDGSENAQDKAVVDGDVDDAVAAQVADETAAEQAAIELQAARAAFDPLQNLLLRHVQLNIALSRRVCELSVEQEANLRTIDRNWLQAEIARLSTAPLQQNLAEGLVRLLGGAVQDRQQQVQPHTLIPKARTAIEEKIKSYLDAEQQLVFEEELNARDSFRRLALAQTLVSAVDQHIILSHDQIDQLVPKIAEWLKGKDLYWQFYHQNRSYSPDIPSSVYADILAPEQRSILSGLHKLNYEAAQIELQLLDQRPAIMIER